MNLSKSLEFFDPVNKVDGAIHIIGVGAMGSRVAELLARIGIPKLHIWDMDTVEDCNIANQMYLNKHIGMKKTDALEEILKDINPTIQVIKHDKYTDQPLSGYIFLSVDSIETRFKIAKANENNMQIKGMFDCRMRLEDAQSYGAKWSDAEQRKAFLSTMDFTDAEAKEATPVSACGTTLSVAPTVVATAAHTVSNFMNLLIRKECTLMIFIHAFDHAITTF